MFQNYFLIGVLIVFEGGGVLFKSGVAFKWIRYILEKKINLEHPSSLTQGNFVKLHYATFCSSFTLGLWINYPRFKVN